MTPPPAQPEDAHLTETRVASQELLLRRDGSVELIRRAETLEDHFATLDFEPDVLKT